MAKQKCVIAGSLDAVVSPCPSCGSEKTAMKSTSLGYTAWWGECEDCGHTGPSYFDKAYARTWWNGLARRARANDQALRLPVAQKSNPAKFKPMKDIESPAALTSPGEKTDQATGSSSAAPCSAALPPLTDEELKWILGRPCFAVAHIAWKLHSLGLYNVERKAEEEQAAAIHWMLSLYLKHGSEWRSIGEEILRGGKPQNDSVSRAPEDK